MAVRIERTNESITIASLCSEVEHRDVDQDVGHDVREPRLVPGHGLRCGQLLQGRQRFFGS